MNRRRFLSCALVPFISTADYGDGWIGVDSAGPLGRIAVAIVPTLWNLEERLEAFLAAMPRAISDANDIYKWPIATALSYPLKTFRYRGELVIGGAYVPGDLIQCGRSLMVQFGHRRKLGHRIPGRCVQIAHDLLIV